MLRYIISAVVCLLAILIGGNAYVVIQYDNVDVINKVSFLLFTNNNKDRAYYLKFENDTNYAESPYNPNDPTVVYIHGFGGSGNNEAGCTMKDAYLESGNFNIILVDWASLAKMPWYTDAVRNSVLVGKYTATMIKWLEQKGALSIPTLHVIGFSLGAHVSAFVGEELAKNKTELIGRITGLDPAGPLFEKFGIQSNGLGKEDAAFVDVIHTNSRFLGEHIAIGHVDFYANKERRQPGCGAYRVLCSHSRAWQYYAESLSNPCGFPGESCSNWRNGVSGCSKQKNILMGVATSKQTRGIFLVQTNSEVPYATASTDFNKIDIVQAADAAQGHPVYTLTQEAEMGFDNLFEYCSTTANPGQRMFMNEINIYPLNGQSTSNDLYTVENMIKK